MKDLYKALFFAIFAITLAPDASYAKSMTFGIITLDVPDAFVGQESARGAELKTPDKEVYTWFEVYKDAESKAVEDEHTKYWTDNDVVLNEPEVTNKASGNINISTMFFHKATWQGKQTVVRYVKIGPIGKDKKLVLMTIWASPDGINAHGKEVEHLLDSLNVKIPE